MSRFELSTLPSDRLPPASGRVEPQPLDVRPESAADTEADECWPSSGSPSFLMVLLRALSAWET